MGDLVAAFLGIVDGYFSGLFDALASILSGMVSQPISGLSSVGRFDSDSFGASIDVGDRAFGHLHSVLANVVQLFGRLLAPVRRLMHCALRAFLQSVKSLFRPLGSRLGAVDHRSAQEMKGMLGTVRGLHDDSLGAGIYLLNSTVDGAYDILRGHHGQTEQQI